MGRCETFEHTADLGIRVSSTDLPDLFRTAGEGLFDVIVANRGDIRVQDIESFGLTADSLDELLFLWLNELIYLCETRHRVYSRFDVIIDEAQFRLDAKIGGEPIDRTRHILDHEVKAATRHGLCLHHVGSEWVGEVILDI